MGSFVATGPDGGLYEFEIQGAMPTPEELSSINKKLGFADTAVPESGGDMGSIMAGLRGGTANVATMLARGLYDTAPQVGQGIQDWAQAMQEKTAREYRPTVTEFGQINNFGDFMKYVGGAGGQSLGYMLPALGGAAIAAPLAPYVGGATIAGGLGATAVSLPQFFGSNIQEQMDQNKVGLGETKVLPALGAATVQSGLNLLAPGAFGTLARLGGLTTKEILAPVAGELAERTWTQFAKEAGANAIKAGMVETGAETTQELLAILQANPERIRNMDTETANRLLNSAFGGFVLGTGFGAIGGPKSQADKLKNLRGKFEREDATAKADLIAARNAWYNIQNIDRNAILKEQEAAGLERRADDMMGYRSFDMMGESPFTAFENFSKQMQEADDVGTGPGPMYSYGMRAFGGGAPKRVSSKFMRSAEPLVGSSTLGLSLPHIRQLVQVAETANARAGEAFPLLLAEAEAANVETAMEGVTISVPDVQLAAFKGAVKNIGIYKNATDGFVFKASQDAWDAYSEIKEAYDRRDALGDLGIASIEAEDVAGQDATANEDQRLADEARGFGQEIADVGKRTRLTIDDAPKTQNYDKKQLEGAMNMARMIAMTLQAEAENRAEARAKTRAEGGDPEAEDIIRGLNADPGMMTAAERTGIARNAKRMLDKIDLIRMVNAPRAEGENTLQDRLNNVSLALSKKAGWVQGTQDKNGNEVIAKRDKNGNEVKNEAGGVVMIPNPRPVSVKNIEAMLKDQRDFGAYRGMLFTPVGADAAKGLAALQGGRFNREFADRLTGHAESAIEQIKSFESGKRRANKRGEEEIQAERERWKVILQIEKLMYDSYSNPANIFEAKKLADTLGDITLYSIDGRSWSDDPDKLRDADPKRYEALLAEARAAQKGGDRLPTPIKKMTMPYWEFYKRSAKSDVKGTKLYRIGSNVKELLKESDEWFAGLNAEYWATGGVEQTFADVYSGTRPEDRVTTKDPALAQERREYKLTTGKKPTKEQFPDRLVQIRYRTGERPTMADAQIDLTNRMSFPAIMQDIQDQYVGFKGVQGMSFLQFDAMREAGEFEIDPKIRRRLADIYTSRLIEEGQKGGTPKPGARQAQVGNQYIGQKLDEYLAEVRKSEADRTPNAGPPLSSLTQEEQDLVNELKRLREEESSGSLVAIDTAPKKYTPPPVLAKVRLTGKSPYLAKDQAKADKATKFIGRGSAVSSTAEYAKNFGALANTGSYTSEDTVFISVEGRRGGRQEFDPNEVQKALDAGATIITDGKQDRARFYNLGEQRIAAFLNKNGYTEVSDGTWKPKSAAKQTPGRVLPSLQQGIAATVADAAPEVAQEAQAESVTAADEFVPVEEEGIPAEAAASIANFREQVSAIDQRDLDTREARVEKARLQAALAEDIDKLGPEQQEQLYDNIPEDVADAIAATFTESVDQKVDVDAKPPAPNVPKKKTIVRRRNRRGRFVKADGTTVPGPAPEVIEGEVFDKNDPRWGEPDPASKPEEGPVKGPSSESIIKPNLPATGTTTIYSTNGEAWTRDREAAEAFGGQVTEITLFNETINQYGALSKSSGTLFFKSASNKNMTLNELAALGAETEAPIRTYFAPEPETQEQAQDQGQAQKRKGPMPEFITLYSVLGANGGGGRRWHPNREWVARIAARVGAGVQEATLPTGLAEAHSQKETFNDKVVLVFPEPGKGIRDLEMQALNQSRKPGVDYKLVPEGKITIEAGKRTIIAPSLQAAASAFGKLPKESQASAVFRDAAGNTYTINDVKSTIDANKSGANLPIPAGRMVILFDGKDFTPAASVRDAHNILKGFSGKMRAAARVRDEAGNIYTPAQIQNFTDRINAGEKVQPPQPKADPQKAQAEKDAETKINLDAEAIRQAITQISAAMMRVKAAQLRAEAQKERAANAPARAAAAATMREMEAKRAAAETRFKEILDRVGMKNVRVELVRTIVGAEPGDVVEGVYDPGKGMIQIAEDVWHPDMSLNDFVTQVSGVLAHELIHHMKAANAFSGPEWKVLVKHAMNMKATNRTGKLNMTFAERAAVIYRNDNLTEAQRPAQIATVEEEAVAEVLRDFVVNGVQAPPQVRSLFKRIIGWIRGLFVYKSGKANQILENIMSGKYDDAAYNVQATGPQNANTFSIAQKFRATREERRADEVKRKAAEAAKQAWREQEARVGGLTLTPRGTSEGYKQGRGSALREARREAMDKAAEEARKASEDAKRSREKFEGRRTWVATPTVSSDLMPNPPPAVKFSRPGVRLNYLQDEASTITELAGAGPDSTRKYYSFSAGMGPMLSMGRVHGMVDEANPSVFYVFQSNFDFDAMPADDMIAFIRMLRKDLGPDVAEVRGVGQKVEETFKEYAKKTQDMLSRYDDLVEAISNNPYKNQTRQRDATLALAEFLRSMRTEASQSRDVGDMLYDISSDAQIDALETLERTDSAVKSALSNLLQADARRMETNRVAVAEQVGLKYAKYNLNPARVRQVQNQEVYAAAANMVRVGLGKIGFSSETANWAQEWVDAGIQRMQDKLLPLGRIVDELRKKGIDIPSHFDAYSRYNSMQGRTADRIRVMQETVIAPLFDMIRTSVNFNENDVASLRAVAPNFADFVTKAGKGGLNKGFANAYAAAMHAPERNAVGAQRNINSTDPADPYGSGFDTAEALEAQRWFAAHKSYPEMLKIHRGILKMVEYINALRAAYHLSPDWDKVKHGEQFIAAGYPDGFRNYVPLRGIGDEDQDIDPTSQADRDVAETMRVGKGISTRYPEDRAFLGRGSRVLPDGSVVLNQPPPMILEHLVQMGMQAAIRGEKNFVGQGIKQLLATFGGQTIDQYGRPVELNKLFKIIYDAPVERRLVDGVVKQVQDRTYKDRKNVFVTKERRADGKIHEVVIEINEDYPMLVRALVGTNGYGSEDTSRILGFIAPLTRMLGELSTKYNPLFPLTNFPRDLVGAMINLQQHQIQGLSTKVLKGVPSAFTAMWQFQTQMGLQYLTEGKERPRRRFIAPDGTDMMELIEKYLANGGSFDIFATSTLEDVKNEINEMISPDPGNIGKTKQAFKRMGNYIESYNKSVENSIRLSTFKAMLEEGMDIDTAVRAAKNVTTNYHMGGTWKSNVSALWMFFNANIQGNTYILSALARSQRVRNVVGAVMVAGFMQDMIMSMLAGEDDETGDNKYDQIPDYILQNKMIFVDPTGASENGFLSLAMPYGYNGAHNFGRALSRLIRGRYEVQEAAGTMVDTIANAFNPLGESSSLLNFAAPTLLDPVIDLYMNTDWAGRNIYPKTNPFQPDTPLSQRHWNNTGDISKGIAEVLHQLGGGTPMREGSIAGISTEISPDAIDYLFKYYLGGVGSTIGQVTSFLTGTIPRALSGEEVEVREIPILSKFAGNIGSSVTTEKFFKVMDEAKIVDAEVKKAVGSGDYDYIRETLLTNKDMMQFAGIAKAIGAARSSITSKIRQIENNTTIPDQRKREMIDPLKLRVKELERNLVKQYNMRVRDAKVQ